MSDAAVPEARRGWLGIRAQLVVLVTMVCVAGVGAATWVHLEAQTRLIRRGLEEQSIRTAEVLARSMTAMILRGQVSALRELSEEALRSQGAEGTVAPVVYVAVTDERGGVLFDSQEDEGRRVLGPEVGRVLTRNGLAAHRLVLEVVPDVGGGPVLDVAVPCAVVGVDGVLRPYGLVRLGVRLDALGARWWAALAAAGYAALAAILLGVLVGLMATGRIMGFVHRMVGVVQQIGEGDLTPRIHDRRPDELGDLAGAIDRMADDLQKRELLKRYISAHAWDEIEERGHHEAEDLEGTLREVTVLFLDIRNYTSLSEEYESREIVAMLNEVFQVLIDVVDDFGGVLDKFIGDALLVVFYPGEESDDAVRAVYAACRMQEALVAFNEKRRFYGRDAISIGVGINTGTVIAGSVGSEQRKDYTVIGDPVNVAARLQERAKEGRHTRIILSESTYGEVSSLVEVSEMPGGGAVRGKKEVIRAFEVVTVKELQAILDDLEAEDPRVRKEAFQALEAAGGEDVLPHLVRVLGSAGELAVLKAIPILARVGRESGAVTELVASLLQEEQDPRVLATAIRAVGNLPAFEDLERLKGFLIHEDARVRANTIEALEARGGGGYVDAVAPLLHDPNQRVKANAAVMLWKYGRSDVVRVLSKLAGSDSTRERASAVFALGELFVSEATPEHGSGPRDLMERAAQDLEQMSAMVDALIERLEDPDPGVVERAVHALAKARSTRALPSLARLAAREDCPVDPAAAIAGMVRVGTPPRVSRLLREWRASRPAEPSA